jgi:hypothetical protein
MDVQPKDGQRVMQLFCYGKDHKGREDCAIGIRDYLQNCTFEAVLNCYKQVGIEDPDFWWIAIEDFPFPKREDKDEV